MNRNSVVYSYGYPYTWSNANYAAAYYPYAIPSEASRKLPSKQKTSNNGDGSKSSWLLIAVIILAILLLTAIIGLIAIGVLYEKERDNNTAGGATTISVTKAVETTTMPVTTQPPPTVIGFNVTNTKLIYSQDMANRYSAVFNNTDNTFCYMIENDWLGKKYPDCCQCIEFKSGSVIATVHLTFDSSLGKPDDLLNEMKGVIPASSAADDRTNRVEPTDIVIV